VLQPDQQQFLECDFDAPVVRTNDVVAQNKLPQQAEDHLNVAVDDMIAI